MAHLGTYVCIAQLNIGPRFGNADLTVLVPPSAPRIIDPSGKIKLKNLDGENNLYFRW